LYWLRLSWPQACRRGQSLPRRRAVLPNLARTSSTSDRHNAFTHRSRSLLVRAPSGRYGPGRIGGPARRLQPRSGRLGARPGRRIAWCSWQHPKLADQNWLPVQHVWGSAAPCAGRKAVAALLRRRGLASRLPRKARIQPRI